MVFLIFLLLWPFAEIALFSQVASRVGIPATILLCLASAALGFVLLQWQGIKTLVALREAVKGDPQFLQQGMFDGICTVVTACLLILPGFLSDGAGLLLLLAPVRQALRGTMRRHFVVQASAETDTPRDHGIIEGEFTRLDGEDKPLLHSSPNHQ